MAHSANGEYCGSGRGVPGVNLVEILSECQNTLSHWGGHPIAVGLGLKGENLDIFIPQFLAAVKKSASVKKEDSHILIDAVVNKEELRYELLWEMNKLNPYGQGNPEPILAVKKIVLDSPPRKISNGEHFQFSLHNGNEYVRGIAWRMGNDIPPVSQKIDLAFRLRYNRWNGQSSLQLVLEDWKLSGEI